MLPLHCWITRPKPPYTVFRVVCWRLRGVRSGRCVGSEETNLPPSRAAAVTSSWSRVTSSSSASRVRVFENTVSGGYREIIASQSGRGESPLSSRPSLQASYRRSTSGSRHSITGRQGRFHRVSRSPILNNFPLFVLLRNLFYTTCYI